MFVCVCKMKNVTSNQKYIGEFTKRNRRYM